MFADFMDYSRQPVPMLPLERRTGVTEVEIGFDEESAMREARRCLRCWINTVFEGNEDDGSRCILCGGCVDVCPESCLHIGAAGTDSFPRRGAGAHPQQRRIVRRGTGRCGRRRAGRHHWFGHAQGRNQVHPLRALRRALPGERDHHGGVPLGGEKPDRTYSAAIAVSAPGARPAQKRRWSKGKAHGTNREQTAAK